MGWSDFFCEEEVREKRMRKAIGIDPDSKGYVCCLVEADGNRRSRKGYVTTVKDLESLLCWVKGEGEVIVAVEGSNGISRPVEQAFLKEQMVFYSLAPNDVSKFRKVVLGRNKNNEKDAETVARYALALQSQGKLEKFRRVWFPDDSLRLLTRGYERRSKELTAEMNRMWKMLRLASPDLYLALAGTNPEVDITGKVLQQQGIVKLLEQKPDLYEWRYLSMDDFKNAMGGKTYRGREKLIAELQKLSASFRPTPPAVSLMIKNAAQTILQMRQQLNEIKKMMGELTAENRAVKTLEQIRGISVITSSTLIAEIIDIRRFANDDHLASYVGLGRSEYASGDRNRMIPNPQFNHRLKDGFITAAKNFVQNNPDSHLTGYFRNLVKKRKMKPNEAYKRVARALVRVIFRRLRSLVEDSSEEQKRSESDMASGSYVRSDQGHESNISPSAPTENDKAREGKIKRDKSNGQRKKMVPVEKL
jgi:transposase